MNDVYTSAVQIGFGFIQKSEEESSVEENLKSKRFKGINELEMAYDDKFLIFNGQSGRFVRIIQEALMDFGFELPKYNNDGIFGSETETAVREFQWASSAVLIDGLIGPETMGLLDKWAVNGEKKENREEKQKERKKERKNEKRVVKNVEEALKERGEELEPTLENKLKIENNRIAQELVSMYIRYKKGENIKDNFMSQEQVRLFFLFDKGDPKNGANPHYLSNVDKAATNNSFEQLDKKIDPGKDIETQVAGFVFRAEKIARQINGGFEEWRSKSGGIERHVEKKDYEALESYFKKRTTNRNDIYFIVTHSR